MIKDIKTALEQAKALVFDFDGTLVDSNPIKLGAFDKCFIDYPQHFEAIMAYCKNNHPVHRHIKFRHVFEKILKMPYTPEIEKRMLDLYDLETTQKVIEAPEIPGATKFLDKFAPGREIAVLSSTPHDTLHTILEKRGLKKYFTKIQGAPVYKTDWLKQFLTEQVFKKDEVLFFGDSADDAQASENVGIPFVAVGETKLSKATYHIVNFEGLS